MPPSQPLSAQPLRLRGPSETPRQAPRGRCSEGFSGISSLSRPHNHRKRLSWELTGDGSLFGRLKFEFTRTPRRLMAKLEQGTDVEITTSSSGGRSKHILKLTGRRRGPREAVAQWREWMSAAVRQQQ